MAEEEVEETEEEVEETEEEETEETDDGERSVDDLKKELDATRKALKKANRDAARNRRKATGKTDEEGSDDNERTVKLEREIHTRDAIEELRDRAEEGSLLRTASKAEMRRYVRLLDSVEPDDLEGSIDDLEEKMAHLFDKPKVAGPGAPRVRRRAADDGGDDGKPAAGKMSETTRKMMEAQGLIRKSRR